MTNIYSFLQKHTVETFDYLFDIFDTPTYEGEYYNLIKQTKNEQALNDWDPDAIYWNNFLFYAT